MKWENDLTQILQVKYPIVQAPMLGVTTPEMVAAIAAQGGLGSLPVGSLAPEKTLELIQKTRALTNAPFAVNIFTNTLPQKPDEKAFEAMQHLLEKISIENNFGFKRQSYESLKFNSYTEQVDCLLSERVPIVSFTFGILDTDVIKAFKQQGTILIGTATCLKEAQILDEIGIDIITAQGIEAGGHRGTFLTDEPLPMIGLMSLLPQLVNKIQKPILAAGGISNGRAIKAALTLGAQGVQVGTAFVSSDESAAIPAYKEALQHVRDVGIILTKTVSGKWARGLRNKFITAVEAAGITIPEFPVQGSLTAMMRMEAQQQNNIAFTSLWAGQSAAASVMKPAAEIFDDLVRETEGLGEGS